MTAIVWMHRDVRLSDHPALEGAWQAVGSGQASAIEVVFSWSDSVYGDWMPGQAQQWWIHVHLQRVLARLACCGIRLVATRTAPSAYIAGKRDIHSIHYNAPLLPAARREAARLRQKAEEQGVPTQQYAGDLLHDPDRIRTQQGDPYKVFTPFHRRFREQVPAEQCEPMMPACIDADAEALRTRFGASLAAASALEREAQEDLDALDLHPRYDWVASLKRAWAVGEEAAHARLETFVSGPVMEYTDRRDRPAVDGTSRMSPYLAIGVVSPRQVYDAISRARRLATTEEETRHIESCLREIVWREFSYHLLHHFPHTPSEPLRPEWKRFPWRDDAGARQRWEKGTTGFPIVDAGMRQLWQTGWMHNRLRMITASFLTKDLMLSWQVGAQWFWNTLIDADLASNTLGWQWAAGSGADAQPWFRIFNPDTQLRKFDPDGTYVRRWIPEFDALSYPAPMLDHAVARARALAAYKSFKA